MDLSRFLWEILIWAIWRLKCDSLNKLKFFVENVLFTCCFSWVFWGVFPDNAGGPLLHSCLLLLFSILQNFFKIENLENHGKKNGRLFKQSCVSCCHIISNLKFFMKINTMKAREIHINMEGSIISLWLLWSQRL